MTQGHFNLYFSDDYGYWLLFKIVIAICLSFFENCLCNSFGHLWIDCLISLVFNFYRSLWILDISFWCAAGKDFLLSCGLSVLFWLLSLLYRNWISWNLICSYLGLIPVLLVFVQKALAFPNVLKVSLCFFFFLEVSVFQILNKVSDIFWIFFLYKRKDTDLISFSC